MPKTITEKWSELRAHMNVCADTEPNADRKKQYQRIMSVYQTMFRAAKQPESRNAMIHLNTLFNPDQNNVAAYKANKENIQQAFCFLVANGDIAKIKDASIEVESEKLIETIKQNLNLDNIHTLISEHLDKTLAFLNRATPTPPRSESKSADLTAPNYATSFFIPPAKKEKKSEILDALKAAKTATQQQFSTASERFKSWHQEKRAERRIKNISRQKEKAVKKVEQLKQTIENREKKYADRAPKEQEAKWNTKIKTLEKQIAGLDASHKQDKLDILQSLYTKKLEMLKQRAERRTQRAEGLKKAVTDFEDGKTSPGNQMLIETQAKLESLQNKIKIIEKKIKSTSKKIEKLGEEQGLATSPLQANLAANPTATQAAQAAQAAPIILSPIVPEVTQQPAPIKRDIMPLQPPKPPRPQFIVPPAPKHLSSGFKPTKNHTTPNNEAPQNPIQVARANLNKTGRLPTGGPKKT